jgi:hypothetical protein
MGREKASVAFLETFFLPSNNVSVKVKMSEWLGVQDWDRGRGISSIKSELHDLER